MRDIRQFNARPFALRFSADEIRHLQWSIANLVRYAPCPDESRIVYMFYLRCDPPFRDEYTTNHCLASLIYVYGQSRDPAVRVQGLDLITIALDRGMGLPGSGGAPRGTAGQTLLANVSIPILKQVKLRISDDGRVLEHYNLPQSWKRPPLSRQQNPPPLGSQGPSQHSMPQHRPESQSQPGPPQQGQHGEPQSRQPQERPDASKGRRDPETRDGPPSPQHQFQASQSPPASRVTVPQEHSTPYRGTNIAKSPVAASASADDDDDEEYQYKPKSRYIPRTIAFVPASTNAALQASNGPSTDADRGSRNKDDEVLAAKVGQMHLGQSSED